MPRKILYILFAVICFAAIGTNAADTSELPVCIRINGTYIDTDVFPEIIDGTTFVPVRCVSEAFGSEVDWNGETENATIIKDGDVIILKAGDKTVSFNGKKATLSAATFIKGGRIMVPLRFISESFGATVNWNADYYIVDIRLDNIEVPENLIADRTYDTDHIMWLSRIIESESGGEVMEGKIAVGNVVLNRVESSDFPDTIYRVIFDDKYGVQFEPVLNGTIYNTPSRDSVIAAKFCLEGINEADSSLYFLNPKLATNTWIMENRELCKVIGSHWFYY